MNEIKEMYAILQRFAQTSRYVELEQGLDEYIVYTDEVSDLRYSDNQIHMMKIRYKIEYYSPIQDDKKYEFINHLTINGFNIEAITQEVSREYLILRIEGVLNGR